MKIEYITFIYFLIFYYIFELLHFILTSAFFSITYSRIIQFKIENSYYIKHNQKTNIDIFYFLKHKKKKNILFREKTKKMYFILKKSMNFCKNHFAREWSSFYFECDIFFNINHLSVRLSSKDRQAVSDSIVLNATRAHTCVSWRLSGSLIV